MVSEEHLDPTAGFFGFLLQAAQQPRDGDCVVAAVEEISGLNQDRLAADPSILLVDQFDGTQDGGQRALSPMDVANGVDRWAGLLVGGRRRAQQKGDRDRSEPGWRDQQEAVSRPWVASSSAEGP